MQVFLTGGAGFIGFHAAKALLARGHAITAIDDLNPYYDPRLKRDRLKQLEDSGAFRFVAGDIADEASLTAAADGQNYDIILHLAAQAGVRYAAENPRAYTRSNLVGHHNILELARLMPGLQQLLYASSSSVYGNDTQAPYAENARADHPVSFYGATKRAGELLSHSYAELFGIRQTGFRFFTVYGPWGRPDMAYWLFTDAILRDKPIPVFGGGKLRRDFTYVDDIIDGIVAAIDAPFALEAGQAPHRIYNLGNSHPEEVSVLIHAIEKATGKIARTVDAKGPPGDVRETYADVSNAARDLGFTPRIPLSEGIPRFVDWFREYHRI